MLEGRATWDGVDEALDEHAAFLARFTAEQNVQTNEVARAWALLLGLLSLGSGELDLLELGASAGLLLCLDRYGYRYTAGGWGSGRPLLEGDDHDGPPASLLERGLEIVRRRGVDRSPIDITSADGARLLQAFLWAGQDDRRARLDEAIATVREDPPELIASDYVEALPSLLSDRTGRTVVMTSVTTMYLDDEHYAALVDALATAGDLTWLSLEGPRGRRDYEGMQLVTTAWPGGERRVLAEHVDFHGARLTWTGP